MGVEWRNSQDFFNLYRDVTSEVYVAESATATLSSAPRVIEAWRLFQHATVQMPLSTDP